MFIAKAKAVDKRKISNKTVGKAMKFGKGTKIMKKPCGKGFKQRAIAGKKKRSPKQHFEATMDKIHEEWRDVVSYNKSFRCSPPCTWPQLLAN